MHSKYVLIPLLILSTCLVSIQYHAKSVRDVVNPQQEIPVLQVNINQASATEIAEVLVGVGLSKANAIVDYRTANGPFESIEQLQEVKGIGSKTLAKNRTKIILTD